MESTAGVALSSSGLVVQYKWASSYLLSIVAYREGYLHASNDPPNRRRIAVFEFDNRLVEPEQQIRLVQLLVLLASDGYEGGMLDGDLESSLLTGSPGDSNDVEIVRLSRSTVAVLDKLWIDMEMERFLTLLRFLSIFYGVRLQELPYCNEE